MCPGCDRSSCDFAPDLKPLTFTLCPLPFTLSLYPRYPLPFALYPFPFTLMLGRAAAAHANLLDAYWELQHQRPQLQREPRRPYPNPDPDPHPNPTTLTLTLQP
jgi:hypothetical protein